MSFANGYSLAEAQLLISLSELAYTDETPNPGETIPQQEARMLGDINAALCQSAYSSWSVAWGPILSPDRSNMMYIAGSPTSSEYAVAIRGTDWSFWMDWLEDFASMLPLVSYPYLDDPDAKVAAGTSLGLSDLIAMDPVSYLQQLPSSANIFVTGHSLGGCLASAIAPYLAEQLGGAGQLKIYTFAAPSAGNGSFASDYNKLFTASDQTTSTAFRLCDSLDVVPNAWASLGTIETYYPPLLPCPTDIKDLVDEGEKIVGTEYVQVGLTATNSAIELPGTFLLSTAESLANLSPIGDALFLIEAGFQHSTANYQNLLKSPSTTSSVIAKARGFLKRRGLRGVGSRGSA